ncbi:MAG: radical SAM protein [Syntrophotaleaceae bacterium]
MRDIFETRQTRLPWGPQKLNLCYDRTCNLACSSCRSEVYKASAEDHRRTEYLSDRVQRELAPQARQLISGTGDPFASRAYRRLLEELPLRLSLLESVHLHSNGLLRDGTAWQDMREVQPFVRSAEISIDAASAATYAVNRGGNFERLLENLAFLAGLPVDITLSFVVQHNNYQEMQGFVDLAKGLGFGVYFSQLVNWGTYRREEFLQRAVHLPQHPEHLHFCSVLQEVAVQQRVDIGNLRSVLR